MEQDLLRLRSENEETGNIRTNLVKVISEYKEQEKNSKLM
jgi:hypothetical protein